MSPELTAELRNRYPRIFENPWFSFDCDDGWYSLIDRLCSRIQFHIDKTPQCVQPVALQVKEKFGGLRFYITTGDEIVYSLIEEAERQSMKTCEVCASTVDVECRSIKPSYWIRSLCSKCRAAIQS